MGLLTRSAALAILGLCLMAGPAAAQGPRTFTVNNTGDGGDVNIGNGACSANSLTTVCTLRAAIQEANSTTDADTVILPANANPYTLTLSSPTPEDASATGDLDITQPLTIDGGGARGTTVRQTVADRVFDVRSGPGTVTLEGLTITGGAPTAGVGDGAGLRNSRALTQLTDAAVRGNDGGTGTGGAGIDNETGAGITISRSLLTGNRTSANVGGGGILSVGTLTLLDSTIDGNTAPNGAAIQHTG